MGTMITQSISNIIILHICYWNVLHMHIFKLALTFCILSFVHGEVVDIQICPEPVELNFHCANKAIMRS